MDRRASRIVLGVALLALVGGGVAWCLHRPALPPPPPPEDPREDDTGLSRKAVEDRMRAIGYVQ